MKIFVQPSSEVLFNEVLFRNRNKKYGAYILRTEEDHILFKSTFLGIALIGAISIFPLVFNAFQTVETKVEKHKIFDLKDLNDTPDKPPIIIKPLLNNLPKTNTVKYEIPNPTTNPTVEKPSPSVKDFEKANIGTENIVGELPPVSVTPPISAPVNVSSEPKMNPVIDNTPKTVVDIEATFSGGINSFRSKVVENFDTNSFNGTGDLMKTTVSFIIEKDGTISNIKAVGGNAEFSREAEKTIKNIRDKWVPAKLNGQYVRSYFKFPISIQFE